MPNDQIAPFADETKGQKEDEEPLANPITGKPYIKATGDSPLAEGLWCSAMCGIISGAIYDDDIPQYNALCRKVRAAQSAQQRIEELERENQELRNTVEIMQALAGESIPYVPTEKTKPICQSVDARNWRNLLAGRGGWFCEKGNDLWTPKLHPYPICGGCSSDCKPIFIEFKENKSSPHQSHFTVDNVLEAFDKADVSVTHGSNFRVLVHAIKKELRAILTGATAEEV